MRRRSRCWPASWSAAAADAAAAAGTGRLYKALVDSKKALDGPHGRSRSCTIPGFVTATATLSNDQSLDEARKTMMDTIAAVATDPPTADEVARARTRILQGMETRMANSQQAALGLSETIAAGDWRLYFVNYDQIKARHAGGSRPRRQALFQAVQPHRRLFHPDADPDRTDVPGAAPISTPSSRTTRPGSRCRPARRSIRRPPTSRSASCARTLQNGMKLAMLPKTTRGDTVHGHDPAAVRRREVARRHARDRPT